MKVKDKFIQEQHEEFELDLAYEEWLRDNFKEPNAVEILDMARENLSYESFMEMQWAVCAKNNIYYKPKQGA